MPGNFRCWLRPPLSDRAAPVRSAHLIRHHPVQQRYSRQTLRQLVHRQKSFHGRLKNLKNLAGHKPLGPLWPSRGEDTFFCGMQGRTRAPGGYRFHLPVGQPLASDCRSVADWDPFLGLMRFGSM